MLASLATLVRTVVACALLGVLSFPGGAVSFPIDPFNKTCLLNGVDELGYILGFEPEIAAFEVRR